MKTTSNIIQSRCTILTGLIGALVMAGCATIESVQQPQNAIDTMALSSPEFDPSKVFVSSASGPLEPQIHACATLAPLSGKVCQYTAGSTDALLIKGNLLTAFGVLQGGDLLIQSGKVSWLGCGDPLPPSASGAAVLTCPQGAVSPGLINSHDHLGYDQQPPRLPCAEDVINYKDCAPNPPGFNAAEFRFSHRNQWRPKSASNTPWLVGDTAPATPTHSRFFVDYMQVTSQAQVRWAELRQALAGTTSIVGSYIDANPAWPQGMVRNLDVENLQEGLNAGQFEYKVFPQGDTNGVFHTNCAYSRMVGPSVLQSTCFIPHIAEGIDYFAQTELKCVTDAVGTSGAATLAYIHSVAGTAEDGKLLSDRGVSVVWAPRSNTSLYGNTAQIPMYDAQGIMVALSTDWTPSGSINLLDEMACVRRWNDTYFGNYFSDYSIWLMSTLNAAYMLNVFPKIGMWSVGAEADVAIFDASGVAQNYYRAVTSGGLKDVALVMRSGVPLTGNTQLLSNMPSYAGNCESIGSVCGVDKSACLAREWGTSWTSLQQANANSYMLFDNKCRDPEQYAPSCTPQRLQAPIGTTYTGVVTPSDSDGDGIPDGADNCVHVFNPVRPMDVLYSVTSGVQLDCDRDGLGDACDPSPMGTMSQCISPYPPYMRPPMIVNRP